MWNRVHIGSCHRLYWMGRRAFTNSLCGFPLCVRRSSVASHRQRYWQQYTQPRLNSSWKRRYNPRGWIITDVAMWGALSWPIYERQISTFGRFVHGTMSCTEVQVTCIYGSSRQSFQSGLPSADTLNVCFYLYVFRIVPKWDKIIVSTSALHDCIWLRNTFRYYTLYMYDVASA